MKKFSKKYAINAEKNTYDLWQRLIEKNKPKKILGMLPISLAGDLHIWNTFSLYLQDSFSRYLRMKWENISLVPTFHHSSFLLQIILEEQLLKKKWKKVLLKKKDFGKLMINHIQEQKVKTENMMKILWITCDWSKEQFTLSEWYMRFLKRLFVELYEKNIIYKEREITYWNKEYQTVVGDTDIEWTTETMKKYMIRYFIDTKKDSVVVGTFRPDTIFADVALAVNPLDKRYKKFVNKKVIIPIINKAIPIIVDEEVDMTVDNGICRITAGHDIFGLEIAKKHGLPVDQYAIDTHGNFTELAETFAWKSVVDFFDNIIQYLEDISNLDQVVEVETLVPLCKKTGVFLEPLAMEQRFLRISDVVQDHFREIIDFDQLSIYPDKQILLDVLDDKVWCISRQHSIGQPFPVMYSDNKKPEIFSESKLLDLFVAKWKKDDKVLLSLIIFNLILDWRLDKNFLLEELIDILCAPSLADIGKTSLEEYLQIYASAKIKAISKKEIKELQSFVNDINSIKQISHEKIIQKMTSILEKSFLLNDEGNGYVFDFVKLTAKKKNTFLKQEKASFGSVFASILMFVALSENLDIWQEIYPFLIVGNNDIPLFMRSALLNLTYSRNVWCDSVIFHGLCYDKFGDLIDFVHNNATDPYPLVQKYWSDALRLALFDQYREQKSFVFDESSLSKYFAVTNKLWNACRYSFVTVLGLDVWESYDFDMNIIGKDIQKHFAELQVFDLWILYVLQEYFDEVEDYFLRKEIGGFCEKIIQLVNQEFGEWYIEIIKLHKTEFTKNVILRSIGTILKLLYPYLPFVTEKLWTQLWFKWNLFSQKWEGLIKLPGKNYKIHLFMDIVRSFLCLKDETDSKKHETVELFIQATPDFLESIGKYEDLLKILVNAETINYFRQQEDIDKEYLVDHVIDIKIGVKKIEQKSKKEYLLDLQKQIEKKREFLQYLRWLIGSANMNQQYDIAEMKQAEMVVVKKEIEDLEFEYNNLKFKK